MKYDRDPRFLHPFIHLQLEQVLDAIQAKLPQGFTCRMISGHRSPADQFELFKKGRKVLGNRWVIVNKSEVVTHRDGYIKLSRHNYLPSTAIDIGIFNEAKKYVADAALYRHVAQAKKFGLDWGGDWKGFVDAPHLEIPTDRFYQRSIDRDNGVLWQRYLQLAGVYTGALDGIFGPMSLRALEQVTGQKERNMDAWSLLVRKFGPGALQSAVRP